MIDHVSLRVHDLDASRRFYRAALAPLGYELIVEFGSGLGFGAGGKPDFWLGASDHVTTQHIAFAAPDRKTVDAFYAAAMAMGGRDNGPPGLRPEYHPTYYGAFVLDPDGHNIEAVCHRPEGQRPAKAAKARPEAKAAKARTAKAKAAKPKSAGPKGKGRATRRPRPSRRR